ncbi:unnamed protein product [Toxocara canis]|uniref:Uncharacterized protein n=1 Tax=Toxocara canis TaxID=6265 RepID=A0A3P7F3N3_TOXCA|nr:unnamed protein product [Toxocara canis]
MRTNFEVIERVIRELTTLVKNVAECNLRGRSKEFTLKNENKVKGRKPCAFCQGEHWNNQCSEYPDVKSRTKRGIEAKLCFNCLGTGHQRNDGYESALKTARTEVYELHAKNIKVEETLKKIEVIVINLQKKNEATRGSLILKKPRVDFKNNHEFEEEISRLRGRYDELSKLLKCADELPAKLEAEATDTAHVDILHRKVEMLDQQLNEKNVELLQLDQRRNDAERSFGEHKQWLRDANYRIGELTSEVNEKE